MAVRLPKLCRNPISAHTYPCQRPLTLTLSHEGRGGWITGVAGMVVCCYCARNNRNAKKPIPPTANTAAIITMSNHGGKSPPGSPTRGGVGVGAGATAVGGKAAVTSVGSSVGASTGVGGGGVAAST